MLCGCVLCKCLVACTKSSSLCCPFLLCQIFLSKAIGLDDHGGGLFGPFLVKFDANMLIHKLTQCSAVINIKNNK